MIKPYEAHGFIDNRIYSEENIKYKEDKMLAEFCREYLMPKSNEWGVVLRLRFEHRPAHIMSTSSDYTEVVLHVEFGIFEVNGARQ